MNILHLISSGGFYGAESVISALAHDMRQMGHSVYVAVFENEHLPRNSVATQLEERGISVVRVRCRGRVDRQTIKTIREILHSREIQLLHTHGYKADIYGYLASRRMGVPAIATCHLWTRQTRAIRIYEFLDSLFLRHFDAVVAVSDLIGKEVRRAGIAPGKLTTIDNGIDLSPFESASPSLPGELGTDGRLLVGTVGRLVTQKGIRYFLMAAQQALEKHPDLLFAVVGDGPDRRDLEQLAGKLGIAGSVFFTGSRADMPQVYASLDIFALASLDEGMPMAVLEALASGRPVIATEVGAVAKLIVPGETGIMLQPADTGGLAQAILSLVDNPELRERLGRNGKARVYEQFSSRVMSRKYLQIYERLLESRNRFRAVPLMDSGR